MNSCDRTGDGITNQGTINVDSVNAASLIQIDPYNFTNQGTINVTNGSTLYISPTNSVIDSGVLTCLRSVFGTGVSVF
jgi:hypothetical protein